MNNVKAIRTMNHFFQSMIFITVEFSVLLLLEVLSTLFISVIFMYKYGTVYYNIDKVKLLFERIQYDWDNLKDPVEYEIMKRQANIARWYTKYFARKKYSRTDHKRNAITVDTIKKIYTSHCHTVSFAVVIYILEFLFIAMHYVPVILDAVVPLAKPRPRRILVIGEMFIDQHKYFHMVLLNITISSFIGMTTVIAAETMLMVLVQHVCGLLKVTSYRITRAFDNDCFPVLRHGKKCIVCTKLASAVNIHRSAIMFADCIRDCLAISYLILILFGVASLSLNLYRVSSIRFFFIESL
ncbi:uncharacterized protein LOC112589776 isoform X1 [Harpegnathos saltator]|uniref:uncharacterized protein LOC112589776 isoform X1 n=1 Tax=Harpegnathos saltator TaxID=610380 RepID=UPI000DBEE33D|nr:uncharacterized protein LOC112589776 isoform X1 [Harpegnathos saltator]